MDVGLTRCFALLKQRVDERREGRALSRYDENADEDENRHHWHQPPRLTLHQKREYLPNRICLAHKKLRMN